MHQRVDGLVEGLMFYILMQNIWEKRTIAILFFLMQRQGIPYL